MTKILYVEADDRVRDTYAALLRDAGLNVTTAEVIDDGTIASLKSGTYAGAIVHNLGNRTGLTGLQLLQRLRDGGSDVPVVVVSGDDMLEHLDVKGQVQALDGHFISKGGHVDIEREVTAIAGIMGLKLPGAAAEIGDVTLG